MFFKRRSSRANSYVDNEANPRSQSFDDYADRRPDSSRKESHQNQPASPTEDAEMYPRQQQPQEPAYAQSAPPVGHNAMPLRTQAVPPTGTGNPMSMGMPDLLTAAFNQAVQPYTEKIEQLESQLADMQAWVDQLEQQRAEVHNWIDKRGLRPDVPASIAKIMDTTTADAASTLNAQLDRKITIVNFDLHRLQDDLNDSISSSHFASAMLKFLPDIQRLTLLPSGPRYAFDLILKLGGNLNSHGGIDSADAGDIAARRDFYNRLDETMVDVVQRRFGEGENWDVKREIKRIEKTASYLKTYGVEPYFPSTLEMMKREMEFQPHNNGVPNGQGTPPRSTLGISVLDQTRKAKVKRGFAFWKRRSRSESIPRSIINDALSSVSRRLSGSTHQLVRPATEGPFLAGGLTGRQLPPASPIPTRLGRKPDYDPTRLREAVGQQGGDSTDEALQDEPTTPCSYRRPYAESVHSDQDSPGMLTRPSSPYSPLKCAFDPASHSSNSSLSNPQVSAEQGSSTGGSQRSSSLIMPATPRLPIDDAPSSLSSLSRINTFRSQAESSIPSSRGPAAPSEDPAAPPRESSLNFESSGPESVRRNSEAWDWQRGFSSSSGSPPQPPASPSS